MIERLVTFASTRQPDDDILARLRAIDPTVELVYVGGGRWWLGSVKPSPDRRRTGLKMLQVESKKGVPSEVNLLQARLMYQGFGLITEITGDPTGALVEWFRRADWLYRFERPALDAAVEEYVMEHHTERRRVKALQDFAATDGRFLYRYAIKGRRHHRQG